MASTYERFSFMNERAVAALKHAEMQAALAGTGFVEVTYNAPDSEHTFSYREIHPRYVSVAVQ